LIFSEDEDYYTCSEENKVYLVDNRLSIEKDRLNIKSTYTLMEYSGSNPFFINDSRNFLHIEANKILTYFIDVGTICKISKNISK
jgi:hypothetical protein